VRGKHKRSHQKISQKQQGIKKADSAKYVPVHAYDPARNAADDIRDAVAEAGRTGKRVMLEVGGEWCIWCHHMDDFFEQNAELLALREKNFIMVKINFSEENKNEQVLSSYPPVNGYPHIFVLDRNGKLLHSQDTGKLEEGKSYNLTKFMAFLKEWSAPEAEGSRPL
jgi:thioredoxin-related protein